MSQSDTHSQTKNTIFNVYKYFKKLSLDSSNPEIVTFFKQTQAKTAEACGFSERTVQRITADGNKSSSQTQTADPSLILICRALFDICLSDTASKSPFGVCHFC